VASSFTSHDVASHGTNSPVSGLRSVSESVIARANDAMLKLDS
jgi:hypothetical protein